MSSAAPVPGPPKKVNPLIWILVAIVGLILVAGITVVVGGFYVAREFASNPAAGAAKLLAASNPDIEIVSTDDETGTVTFREKSSGKTVTLNFDQLKDGKITFSEDGQQGAVSLGGEATLPDWLPNYPGSTPQSAVSMQGADGGAAVLSFTTRDRMEDVAKFYENALREAGIKVSSTIATTDGDAKGGMVGGESPDKKRSASITLSSSSDGVKVAVMFKDQK
jgi:hypothetical protein